MGKAMNRYFEETLEFIESAEMREYLRTRADWFEWHPQRHCAKIIAASYCPLTKKETALNRLYEASNDYATGNEYDNELLEELKEMCERVRAALAARYEDIDGAVFALTGRYSHFNWDEGALPLDAEMGFDIARGDNDTELFTDYEAAIVGLKEIVAENYYDDEPIDPDAPDWCWFTIEKWVRSDSGKMRLIIDYTLNRQGDVIYFSFMDETEWRHLRGGRYNFPQSFDINLPIPFSPGDIVTIDMSPYVDPFHAVIVTVGDNSDCCCVQAAWVDEQGGLGMAALKHNLHFLTVLSPLYRLARFEEGLPKRETPLYALSEELRDAPETAEAIYERVSNLRERRRLQEQGE